MSSEILFCDDVQAVFVLDIPRSIEHAQSGGRIFSQQPVQTPYVTPEPKGSKRDAYIALLPAAYVEYQCAIEDGIRHALSSRQISQWCHDRALNTGFTDTASLGDTGEGDSHLRLPVVLSSFPNCFSGLSDIQHVIVYNDNGRTATIQARNAPSFHVPAHSCFIWSRMRPSLKIMQEVGSPAEVGARSPAFDLILMDPPWANRSVRRGGKYHTADEQLEDPFYEALAFLESCYKPQQYAAVWVTNKAAVRDKVTQSVIELGFSLVEEWVWVKVTSQGEPVVPLDGVWRKPYEVLLLFRRDVAVANLNRRYILAVPDVHSRKPSLKLLFERLLGVHCVLELFARSLTSGWWSIGNEVLKFQHCELWRQCPA